MYPHTENEYFSCPLRGFELFYVYFLFITYIDLFLVEMSTFMYNYPWNSHKSLFRLNIALFHHLASYYLRKGIYQLFYLTYITFLHQ